MAAGTLTRVHADPVPKYPVVSKYYVDELNSIIAGHNALYADWLTDVTLVRRVFDLAAGSTPSVPLDMITANGIVIGETAGKITPATAGATMTFNTMDVLATGSPQPNHVTVDMYFLDDDTGVYYEIGLDTQLGGTSIYQVYNFTVTLPRTVTPRIRMPDPAALPLGTQLTLMVTAASNTIHLFQHDGFTSFASVGESVAKVMINLGTSWKTLATSS